MDYREYLYRPLSKRFVDILVQEIFLCPSDFIRIYYLIFDPEMKVAWRAAWACQKISEKNPDWFSEIQYLELVDLAISTQHDGLKRGCLSILYNLSLPTTIRVEYINSCFEWMISARCPIAVQALSMKILFKICEKEPDLKIEFQTYLETILPIDFSKGMIAAKNNILKKLNAK